MVPTLPIHFQLVRLLDPTPPNPPNKLVFFKTKYLFRWWLMLLKTPSRRVKRYLVESWFEEGSSLQAPRGGRLVWAGQVTHLGPTHGSALLFSPPHTHRTERDATSWSKGKLRESLVGIVVENEAGRCQISDLKQVEGEASCSSRKGKLIFFYEWNIKLTWKGMGAAGARRAGGSMGQTRGFQNKCF